MCYLPAAFMSWVAYVARLRSRSYFALQQIVLDAEVLLTWNSIVVDEQNNQFGFSKLPGC